jgi:hypothetical protein
MGSFRNSVLFNVPKNYKSGVLASVKPIDGSKDFALSRSGSSYQLGGTGSSSDGIWYSIGSGVPRVGWGLDGTGCPKLKMLLAGSNLFTYSNDFSNWLLQGGSVASTAETGIIDGQTSYEFVEDTNTGVHDMRLQATYTAGEHTITFAVKLNDAAIAAGRTKVQIQDSFSASLNYTLTGDGAVSGAGGTITKGVNGIYYLTKTFTATSSSVNAFVKMLDNSDATSYTGDGVSGFHVFFAQSETGDIFTCPIVTTGSTATRVADTTLSAGSLNGGLISGDQSAFYFDFEIEGSVKNNGQSFRADATGTNNRVEVFLVGSSVSLRLVENNSQQAAKSISVDTRYRAIIKVNGTSFKMFVNGVKEFDQTEYSFNLNSLSFRTDNGVNQNFNGAAVWNGSEVPSDEDCITLTTL